MFPALLLPFILLGTSPGGSELRSALIGTFKQVLPPDAWVRVAETIRNLSASNAFGAAASIAAVGAAWGALNGTWAIMTGLNKAYEVKEERPWWRLLYITFGLTISFTVLGLIALIAILWGSRAGTAMVQHLGVPAHLGFLWRIIQWAVIVVVLFLSFALLYRFGPNLKDRRWQWSNPGSVIAVAFWTAFTLLLRVYLEHSSSSERMYGGLGAAAIILAWLYLTGAAIFIGGEANSEIEKAAAEAGHGDVREAGEERSGGAGSPGA